VDASLSDLLPVAASRRPSTIALCDDLGGELTYSELNDRVIRSRAIIQDSGLGTGDRIVLDVERSCESVVAIHAAIAAGCVVVPVSDGSQSGIQYDALNWLAPSAVIGPRATQIMENIQGQHTISATSLSALSKGPNRPMKRKPPEHATKIAYIVLTSGSTGTPRCIVGAHAAALFCVEEINHALGNKDDDVILCGLPLSFDYGFYQIFLAVAAMCTLRLTNIFENPLGLPRLANQACATALPATPGLIRAMNKSHLWHRLDSRRLRYVCSTGDYLTQSDISSLSEALPYTSVVPMYGLSECKRVAISPPGNGTRAEGGVGYPLPGTETKLNDCFAIGGRTVGELHVAGPHLMPGYWHADGITDAGRYYSDANGKRWLRTGDVFEIKGDGYLIFVDRMDAIIKVGDAKYSLFDAERELKVVKGVSSVILACFDANGAPSNEAPEKIVAFVVADRSRSLTVEKIARDLLAFAVERDIGLVPDEFCFVDRIPLNERGKIDRNRLSAGYPSVPEKYAAPAGRRVPPSQR